MHALITGGARSGKSAFAEALVTGWGARAAYIATAQARDAEMEARIAAHVARRGGAWRTHAEPLDLPGALIATDGAPRLVDCLTLWLSNLMEAERDVEAETAALLSSLAAQSSPVAFVTNEVGGGIVPAHALSRRFRDAAGTLNQAIAAACSEVHLVVCGCPLRIK